MSRVTTNLIFVFFWLAGGIYARFEKDIPWEMFCFGMSTFWLGINDIIP